MRKKRFYWGAFILPWFQHLQDSDLTGSDYKVLFFLCEKMHDIDNRSLVKQIEIADKLELDKGNVSKCIKRLCAKQFIAKIPGGFMINPHLFYVGKTPADRYHYRDFFDQIIRDSGVEPMFEMDEMDSKLKKYHPQTRNAMNDDEYGF